jgi:carbon-monoxide dehydrogenase medium subunit
MLNLRLARPSLLVRIDQIAELRAVDETAADVTIGACVTHSAIADGLTPDIGQSILARIADGIAYRAIRNRGTIGGSLCHADPAADWVTVLTALGAEVLTEGAGRRRAIPVASFIVAAFRSALARGEIVVAVRIPRLSSDARWGYVKLCRKPGEFAYAMSAVLLDHAHGVRRAVIGALGGPPVRLEGAAVSAEAAATALARAGDAIDRHLHLTAFRRALAEAVAA